MAVSTEWVQALERCDQSRRELRATMLLLEGTAVTMVGDFLESVRKPEPSRPSCWWRRR
jgi:hypothetical protein